MNFPDKIFKSIDFRWNFLKNARVDNPVVNKDIANKEYVDTSNTYNTEKVTQYVNPFKLTWVTNPLGKTLKQILDDVFFPLLLPDYVEPNFINVQVEVNSNKIIFYETESNFSVSWNLDFNDRTSNTKATVKFIDSTETRNFSGTTTLGQDSIEFNYSVKSSTNQIIVSRDFLASTVSKQDSYGNNYKPYEMTIPKTINYDLKNHLLNNGYIFSYPILYCLQSDNIDNFTTLTDFTKTSKLINVTGGVTNRNKIKLLIPKVLEDYQCLINNDFVDLNKVFGIPTTKSVNSANENNIQYLVYSIDLGYYDTNQTVNIEFVRYADKTNNI